MDENPYDPRVPARRHYRENLWLRDTLEGVARELERMAAKGQGESDILLSHARRTVRRTRGGPGRWLTPRGYGDPTTSSTRQ